VFTGVALAGAVFAGVVPGEGRSIGAGGAGIVFIRTIVTHRTGRAGVGVGGSACRPGVTAATGGAFAGRRQGAVLL
jgi:hypothetical protein